MFIYSMIQAAAAVIREKIILVFLLSIYLLECFELTLNKQYNRTGGVASTMLSKPSGWGWTFGAISFYYDLIS